MKNQKIKRFRLLYYIFVLSLIVTSCSGASGQPNHHEYPQLSLCQPDIIRLFIAKNEYSFVNDDDEFKKILTIIKRTWIDDRSLNYRLSLALGDDAVSKANRIYFIYNEPQIWFDKNDNKEYHYYGYVFFIPSRSGVEGYFDGIENEEDITNIGSGKEDFTGPRFYLYPDDFFLQIQDALK